MVTLAAGLAACGSGGTTDTGTTASGGGPPSGGASGGAAGTGGGGGSPGSGGMGTDAGPVAVDAQDTRDGAQGNDHAGGLDAPGETGGIAADAGVDGPGVVNALSAVRTYAYHELTSLPVESQYWPVISGNGRVVAFATGTASPTQIAVNVVNADGSGQQEIDRYTPLCYCSGTVDISADGQHVVSTESVQIRHASVGGTANAVLTLDSNEIWDIRISADGTRIFFLLRRDAGISGTSTRLERGVYIVNVDGSGLRQVTGPTLMSVGLGVTADKIFPFAGCGRSMDVSTDATRIAFVTAVAGMETVFAVNADGSSVSKLVDASGGFELVDKIALSGDGRLVAYHVYVADGVVEMGVIGFDGTGRRKLDSEPPAPLAGCEGNLRFTQDGSKLFVSEPSYLYNTDGTGVLQLSMGVIKPPGGTPVKDGTYQGWMNADGTRFVYKNADNANIPQLMLLELNPASLGSAPVLSEPTFTPGTVTVAGLNDATATVRASGTGIKTVGVTFAANGLADVIDRGPGVIFGDSGSNGDAVAGDGLWSGKGFYGYDTPKPGPRTVRFTAEASVGGKRHATVLEAGTVTVQ
jgi:Tol biopolymer transport system component